MKFKYALLCSLGLFCSTPSVATSYSPLSGKDIKEGYEAVQRVKKSNGRMTVDDALKIGALYGFIAGMNYESLTGRETFCIRDTGITLEEQIEVIGKHLAASPNKFEALHAGLLVNDAFTKKYPCKR